MKWRHRPTCGKSSPSQKMTPSSTAKSKMQLQSLHDYPAPWRRPLLPPPRRMRHLHQALFPVFQQRSQTHLKLNTFQTHTPQRLRLIHFRIPNPIHKRRQRPARRVLPAILEAGLEGFWGPPVAGGLVRDSMVAASWIGASAVESTALLQTGRK